MNEEMYKYYIGIRSTDYVEGIMLNMSQLVRRILKYSEYFCLRHEFVPVTYYIMLHYYKMRRRWYPYIG